MMLVCKLFLNVCLYLIYSFLIIESNQIFFLAMNVIRMIKLFGWENKMSTLIANKRNEELKYLYTFRMLELLNNNIKYVEFSYYSNRY